MNLHPAISGQHGGRSVNGRYILPRTLAVVLTYIIDCRKMARVSAQQRLLKQQIELGLQNRHGTTQRSMNP